MQTEIRNGMTIERHDDGTRVCMAPIVVKYLNERPAQPERLHGNDKRMIKRKAMVTAALKASIR